MDDFTRDLLLLTLSSWGLGAIVGFGLGLRLGLKAKA